MLSLWIIHALSSSKYCKPCFWHKGTLMKHTIGTRRGMLYRLPGCGFWTCPTAHWSYWNMKSTLCFTSTSESSKRKPSGMMSHSFWTDIMWRSLPHALMAADDCLVNLSSSLSKSMTCPLVLSMTVTPSICAVNGLLSELSNTVTW